MGVAAAKNAVCSFKGVAMIVNGGSTTLHYDSGYWTNSATGDLGGGNSKTDLFFEKAKKATFTFSTGSQTRSISVDMGASPFSRSSRQAQATLALALAPG